MKNMTRGILLLWVAFAASSICGGQSAPGVAGVDVFVKQSPNLRAVTDARGNFALDAVSPGSYTLTFRARKAADLKVTPRDKAVVATSYSIKVEGTKRSVNQIGLIGDKLLAGVDVTIEVGSGAKVRGQVLAGSIKKMVWIPAAVGSHIPGHWAAADSKEASAFNRVGVNNDDLRNNMQMARDPHQEGFLTHQDGFGRDH
jgi:hypothetical protein